MFSGMEKAVRRCCEKSTAGRIFHDKNIPCGQHKVKEENNFSQKSENCAGRRGLAVLIFRGCGLCVPFSRETELILPDFNRKNGQDQRLFPESLL